MDLIETLEAEHRVLLERLDELERSLRRAAEGRGAAAAEARESLAAGWDSLLADLHVHFRKEEAALFPAAESLPELREGALEPLRAEHREHAVLEEEMTDALAGLRAEGTAVAGGRLWRAALSLTTLLREHIGKEDELLFPRLRRDLGPGALAEAGRRARAGNPRLRKGP